MSQIIGLFGDRGAGKSLLLTIFLRDAYNKGYPVVSNYKLFFPDREKNPIRYMSFAQMCDMPYDLEGAIIGCDEFQAGADSRETMSNRNRKLTKLCTQLRKRHCSLYYTTQRFDLIDKRARSQTDGFICVQPNSEPGFFEAVFMVDDETVVNRRRFYGVPAYEWYDTDEIIE